MTSAIEHLHVKANGITFRVAVSGPQDGPAILCLHGFPEGSMGWRPFMQALQRARIYAPDRRGYPGTDQPRSGYDVFTLTDDVKALFEAMKDGALSSKVAFRSGAEAGCEIEVRPLPGVGHFVDLEAPDKLAQEVARLF